MSTIVEGRSYRFKTYNDNKYLNILTDGALKNNGNVTSYTLDATDMAQVWVCERKTLGSVTGILMKSKKNTAYAIDRYRGSSNYNNADIYTVGTTEADLKDQLVEFKLLTNGCYRIKLAYADLYLTLTSTGTYGGYNIKWQSMTGNSDQLWYAEEYGAPVATPKPVPTSIVDGVYFVNNTATGLNLNVYGSDTVAEERSVNVYAKENCLAQKWTAKQTTSGPKLFTSINSGYALNIYTPTSNCTMHTASGNDRDSTLEFEAVSESEKTFRIKAFNHNRYLVSEGNTNGSNVSWQEGTSGNTIWQFVSEKEMFPVLSTVPSIIKDRVFYVKNYLTKANLNVYGSDTVSNTRNVTTYKKEKSLAQKWVARQTVSGAKLFTKIDETFALNIDRDSSNCTMYKSQANDDDSIIEFIPYTTQGITLNDKVFIIRMVNKTNDETEYRYLAADKADSDSNVSWEKGTSGYCQWQFVTEEEMFPPAPPVPSEILDKIVYLKAEGKDLCLNVHGYDTVANATNVNVYSSEDCYAQKWTVRNTSNGPKLFTSINSAYALNIYDKDNNCTMYIAQGNDTDSVLSFEKVDTMKYRIKMHNYNRYLAIESEANVGSNVSWVLNESLSTVWEFIPKDKMVFNPTMGSDTNADSYMVTKFLPASTENYTQDRSSTGGKISEITIHHAAGNISIESLGSLWQNPNRHASSHYGISGTKVGQYVKERDVAWTNSNWEANCRAVTIEVANSTSEPNWEVSQSSLTTLIYLVADIAKRNNLGKLVVGQNLTYHNMYSSTVCPGPYLMSKLEFIASEANKVMDSYDYTYIRQYGTYLMLVVDNGVVKFENPKEDSVRKMWFTKTVTGGKALYYQSPQESRCLRYDPSTQTFILSADTSYPKALLIQSNGDEFKIKVDSIARDSGIYMTAMLDTVSTGGYDDNTSLEAVNTPKDVPKLMSGYHIDRCISFKKDDKTLVYRDNSLYFTNLGECTDNTHVFKFIDSDNKKNLVTFDDETKGISLGSAIISIDMADITVVPMSGYYNGRYMILSNDNGKTKYLSHRNDVVTWKDELNHDTADILAWCIVEPEPLIVDEWLRLHHNPQNRKTIIEKPREIPIPDYGYKENDIEIKEYYEYSKDGVRVKYKFTNRDQWFNFEDKLNVNKNITQKVINIYGHKKELYNNEPAYAVGTNEKYKGFYWVAVGPSIIHENYIVDGNPGQDIDKVTGETILPMYGQGTVDAVLKCENRTLYLHCLIGDIKAHTWNNGVIQTDRAYGVKNGLDANLKENHIFSYEHANAKANLPEEKRVYDETSCIEFLALSKILPRGNFKNYKIEKIIFYKEVIE